ncbi:MAG: glycosyltransferase family 4 protein [Dokdonella sp.]|nr:glycosyltransferase family 4 protein [Dokdonella sp.]
MKRIAIVVPRCHEKLVGGAEALAWQYAGLLKADYEVDLLTTTASDYVTWANDLPPGEELREGVRIHRFQVARERGRYFHDLHRRLAARFEARRDQDWLTWPDALQDEFIHAQGPCCPSLIEHLAAMGGQYQAVLFVTYLYPTTIDGVQALRHRRWALVPTLHDEALGYFNVIAQMARAAPRLLWNTPAERRLGARLWEVDKGEIVSMAVATERFPAHVQERPYLLYCGRIDAHKGCAMLIEAFEAWQRRQPSNLQLILTGANHLGIKDSAHVRCLGFVEEQHKFELMAGALAFVHPSANESLSIVLLEAMAQGTPGIVNGQCEVLADHVKDSGSGWIFHDPAQLHASIDAALALDATQREQQAARARAYVVNNYDWAAVRARLIAEVEALAAS